MQVAYSPWDHEFSPSLSVTLNTFLELSWMSVFAPLSTPAPYANPAQNSLNSQENFQEILEKLLFGQ